MREINKYLAVVFLAVALLFSNRIEAMQIPQFDHMSLADRSEYVTRLVAGAKDALVAHGQADAGEKVMVLFHDQGGSLQFVKELNAVRIINQQNAAKPDNKKPAYEVEHAFYLTLQDNGISVPLNALLAINKDFKPSVPISPSFTETNKP